MTGPKTAPKTGPRTAPRTAPRTGLTRTPATMPAGTDHPAPVNGDAYIRVRGRDLLQSLYGAMRSIKLYPPDNPVVQRAFDDLMQVIDEFLKQQQELEIRVSGDFIFINQTRLRLELDNYASFSRIIAVFRDAGVGVCRLAATPGKREWTIFLALLQASTGSDSDDRRLAMVGKLEQAGITHFEIAGPSSTDEEFREKAKEAAKRTYAHSVSVTKEVINSVRMGKSPNIKRIKRVVQGLVDQILNEETSLLGLTTLRDYDEYTFTHSVNVCIFAVALGRKLGLTRLQLYDLGIAALLHDIGKSRVSLDVLNKPSGLDDIEWRAIAEHPWLGVLALFQLRGHSDVPYRAMVVAFEHHKKTDLSGYPKHIRPRTLSIYSKLVAVADAFDAATSRRAYQTVPLSPADVLQELRNNPRRGVDQVVVKAFMGLVGHYPVGTMVVLDTFELAIVHSANPVPTAISRPIVRIVSDELGNVLFPGTLVDLTQQDPATGSYARTIVKIADPERYGIRVSDYFV
jgi:HD-GYP domain-containing protein (c-di-GMP phosphodiesterase class II)